MQFGPSSLVEVGAIDVVVAATVDVVRGAGLRRIETVVLDGATVAGAAVVVVFTGAVEEDEEDVEVDAAGPRCDAPFSDVHPPDANSAASAAAVMTWLRRTRRSRIRRILRTSPRYRRATVESIYDRTEVPFGALEIMVVCETTECLSPSRSPTVSFESRTLRDGA